jgi:hypothetical protein
MSRCLTNGLMTSGKWLKRSCRAIKSANKRNKNTLVAWNTALLPEAEQAEALAQIATALPAETYADFYTIVHEMIERKNKHFAEYDRLILDFELVERGNDYHLTVVSRIPSEDETGVE